MPTAYTSRSQLGLKMRQLWLCALWVVAVACARTYNAAPQRPSAERSLSDLAASFEALLPSVKKLVSTLTQLQTPVPAHTTAALEQLLHLLNTGSKAVASVLDHGVQQRTGDLGLILEQHASEWQAVREELPMASRVVDVVGNTDSSFSVGGPLLSVLLVHLDSYVGYLDELYHEYMDEYDDVLRAVLVDTQNLEAAEAAQHLTTAGSGLQLWPPSWASWLLPSSSSSSSSSTDETLAPLAITDELSVTRQAPTNEKDSLAQSFSQEGVAVAQVAAHPHDVLALSHPARKGSLLFRSAAQAEGGNPAPQQLASAQLPSTSGSQAGAHLASAIYSQVLQERVGTPADAIEKHHQQEPSGKVLAGQGKTDGQRDSASASFWRDWQALGSWGKWNADEGELQEALQDIPDDVIIAPVEPQPFQRQVPQPESLTDDMAASLNKLLQQEQFEEEDAPEDLHMALDLTSMRLTTVPSDGSRRPLSSVQGGSDL